MGTPRSGRLRRAALVSGIAIASLAAVIGAATVLISSHHAPAPLALNSPASATTPNAMTGNWMVIRGSEAGYRAREKFINQPATTEAVARTSYVTGGLVVAASGPSLQVKGIHFTVDLSTLQSQDRYATFSAYQRDFFVKTIYLQSDATPNADFKGDNVTLPADIGSGPVTLTVTGKLMLHRVTKHVTSVVRAQLNGDVIEVVGSISVDMRDFNIEVPDISFTSAEPGVIIEYHLFLAHA